MKNPFHHKNRHSVVDMFRPPAGYRLQHAIGTSYSVDFVALTSVMLAFADAESDDDQGATIPEQLFAFTRLAERLKLFVNRGCILLSGVREQSRICAIYDSIIEEVLLPQGSFHPKLWFLSYAPKQTPENVGAEPIHRLVVGSRNLTSSNCWELAAQLDGRTTGRKQKSSIGSVLSGYLSTIRIAIGRDSKVVDAAIEQLPSIDFSMPEGVATGDLAFQWPGEKDLASVLPTTGKEAVIVSPFLGKTFIERISNGFGKTTLVSSRREIDLKLDENLVKKLQPNLFYVNDDPSAEVATRLSLHAKLYFFETNNDQRMLLGSANASRNAWQGINSEAMLSFPVGIKQSNFLCDFVFDSKRENGLHPWIERYDYADWVSREDETEAEKVENLISAAQETLARFEFALNFDSPAGLLWLVPAKATRPDEIQTHIDNGLEIAVIPISLLQANHEQQWSNHPILAAFPDGMSFQASVARLTQFICFRIKHRQSQAAKTIVLKSSSDNFGDFIAARNKELLRAELSAKQFAQFLAALLFDRSHPARKRMHEVLIGKRLTGNQSGNPFFEVLIEDIMLACTEDDSKIVEIGRLLDTFEGTDPDGNEFVDAAFREFWSEFQRAFQAGMKGS